MAKAPSPVRLQADLMNAATVAGVRDHRSAAEQIEYWASIGRSVSQLINPDVLLSIRTGLARLRVEPVNAPGLDPEAVFAAMEQDRASGTLSRAVSSSAIRYQASRTVPGMLEQVTANGQVSLGQFRGGQFVPQDEFSA